METPGEFGVLINAAEFVGSEPAGALSMGVEAVLLGAAVRGRNGRDGRDGRNGRVDAPGGKRGREKPQKKA
jgi:hypothetical protein